MQELELLDAFAAQAALAVQLGEGAERAAGLLRDSAEDDVGRIARLALQVDSLSGPRREAASRLLDALADLIAD